MKRTLAAAAVAFAFASSALWAAEGTITQTGADNTATIEQDTNFAGWEPSTASITQTGDGNDGLIDQLGAEFTASISSTGNDNDATILQNGANAMSASIGQTGDGHGATITQDFANSASASITQEGATNAASITQSATNVAEARPPNGVVATIEQLSNFAGSNLGTSNSASILQAGLSLGTTAAITQEDVFRATASIDQSGGAQHASIFQGIAIDGFASILQRGTSQNATVDQTSTANRSAGRIDQAGDGHSALIRQYFNSNDNTADIVQRASANNATIIQSGSSAEGGSGVATWNDASILQEGSANQASIRQTGAGSAEAMNVATINQFSSGNVAGIAQHGGGGNTALINQH